MLQPSSIFESAGGQILVGAISHYNYPNIDKQMFQSVLFVLAFSGFGLHMASATEHVSNLAVLAMKFTEITCNKEDPTAIELRISLSDLTKMVQSGVFGTASPTSFALQQNLQSYTTYIAYSKERYQMEVARRREEERLRRQEEAARQLAEQRVYQLRLEVAYLRWMLTGQHDAGQGNLQSLGPPDEWQGDLNAYPYV